MIVYKAIIITLLGIVILNIPPAEIKENENMKDPLLFHLYKIGNLHNCYFTIESAWTDENPKSLEYSEINVSEEKDGLQSNLSYLQQTLPNFTYLINESNNRIIHIVDTRLLKQKNYGLTMVMKNVDFSGLLWQLPDYIGKQGFPVIKETVFGTVEGAGVDFTTVVKVTGDNLQVRDVLSNYIPLDERGRILWIARTKLGNGESSRVFFKMK